ncbi:hypothetical protein [Hymenobacter terricola]|uniref:hypothetical protein n=1 Tax=Hymenobacter terricola TaxID=2819236 RepID=UPI001B30B8CB|nr:hypothetical protein [Hymenobacter terricola]
MPYLKDPRSRITLNFHAADYDALTADATRAGHASASKYAMALVQARGAAVRPILDENGRQRVSRLQGKMDTARAALTAAEARAAGLATQLRAAQHELAQRPSRADIESLIVEAVSVAMAQRAAGASPAKPGRAPRGGGSRSEG